MSNESRFQEIIAGLKMAVVSINKEKAVALAQELLTLEGDAFAAVSQGLSVGLKEVGEKFEAGDIYLPHLIQAGSVVDEAVKILEPSLMKASKNQASKKATIVLGTVEGDIHSIGKNIVGMMIKAAGHKVIDIGVDVPPDKFVEAAEQGQADMIGVSALMTFTISGAKSVLDVLQSRGIRDKYKVICGGGAIKKEWAEQVGFDGFAEDAIEAVELVNTLVATL